MRPLIHPIRHIRPTPLACAALAALALASTSGSGDARASHYRLERVDLVTPSEAEALERAGVVDTRALLSWTATLSRRVWLARQTGLDYARLEALATQCDLLRVGGVGPFVVQTLQLAGVQDTRALGRASPDALLERLREVTAGTEARSLLPDVDTLSEWIRAAARMRPLLDLAEEPPDTP